MKEILEDRITALLSDVRAANNKASAIERKCREKDDCCRLLQSEIDRLTKANLDLVDRCCTLRGSLTERCRQIAETNGDTKTAADIAALIEGSK